VRNLGDVMLEGDHVYGDGVSAVIIANAVFFFSIRVFSGLHEIWFQWPAAVLLLIAFLRAAKGRGPS
jgi:hypothetical protein